MRALLVFVLAKAIIMGAAVDVAVAAVAAVAAEVAARFSHRQKQGCHLTR